MRLNSEFEVIYTSISMEYSNTCSNQTTIDYTNVPLEEIKPQVIRVLYMFVPVCVQNVTVVIQTATSVTMHDTLNVIAETKYGNDSTVIVVSLKIAISSVLKCMFQQFLTLRWIWSSIPCPNANPLEV